MELRDYLRLLRRNWIFIVALTLLAIAAAAVYSITRTPQYEGNAKVFVSTQSAATVADLTQGSTYTQQVVKSYADVATTPIVLDRVIEELGLVTTAEQLAAQVVATAPLDTVVLDISATDPDPQLAADIANSVSTSLGVAVEEDLTPSTADDDSPVKITRIQSAQVAEAPVSPNVPMNLVLGALVGMAMALAVSILRETLNTRIRGRRDVELVTSRPILGAITFDPAARRRPLLDQGEPSTPRAEMFRSLRTSLQFLDYGRGSRSMVVTSSVEAEGRTTTAANLAITVADTGSRVVLVDSDLRQPKVAGYFGLEPGVGLSDVLAKRIRLEDALQVWGAGRLAILPAGAPVSNPTELLQSRQMVELLAKLSELFDTVIIDAPPLLPVSDAAILARRASGAIVVCAAGQVDRPELEGALEILDQVEARVIGLVLTMLPTRGPDASGYVGHFKRSTRASSSVPRKNGSNPRATPSSKSGRPSAVGAEYALVEDYKLREPTLEG